MKFVLSAEERELIRSMRMDHTPWQKIEAKLGYSRNVIRRTADEMNLPSARVRKRPRSPASPLLQHAMALVFLSERKPQDIARDAGLGRNAIYTWTNHAPTVTSMEAILRALGYRLVIEKIEENKKLTNGG